MDLTFHVPMQYCFLQHWILLPSPVTARTGCCFCFGSVSSFFLELFLRWSPVAYWAPTDLGSSSFSVWKHLLWRCESAVDCHRDGACGCSRLGVAWALLEEVTINPTMELPELTQDWETVLESTNRTLCAPGPRRKEQGDHKKLNQACLWVFRSLQWRCESVVGCCRFGGKWV